ncbi:hypothetical protein D9M69_611760 [compost metagenome]
MRRERLAGKQAGGRDQAHFAGQHAVEFQLPAVGGAARDAHLATEHHGEALAGFEFPEQRCARRHLHRLQARQQRLERAHGGVERQQGLGIGVGHGRIVGAVLPPVHDSNWSAEFIQIF